MVGYTQAKACGHQEISRHDFAHWAPGAHRIHFD